MTIRQVSWQEFESILLELGEPRAARIADSNGNLEVRVPLPEHEISRALISEPEFVLTDRATTRQQICGKLR